MPTIFDLVETGLSLNPGIACSTKRGGKWHPTSVADFREQIEAFALGLHAIGIRKGDRVALHSENSTEWLVIDQAILSLGAVTVPIYTTQHPDQTRYIIENAEARVYIVSTEELFESQRTFMDQAVERISAIGILGSYADRMQTYAEILDKGRALRGSYPDLHLKIQQNVSPEDLATLIYTSGTTGTPKGVMLSHSNLASSVVAVSERLPFDAARHRGDNMLSYLPLAHALERAATIVYLYIGSSIHFVEDFTEIADDFKVVRPLHMATVPRLLEKVHAAIRKNAAAAGGLKGKLAMWAISLAENYDVTSTTHSLKLRLADRLVFSKIRDKVFGGNLQALTSGGAALAPVVMSFFNGIGIFCGQGYGLTETSPVISIYKKGHLKPGSIGLPVIDVEVKIADDGEILARGPNIMQGYYKMPDQTAEVMSEGGWFHTGDIGHLDEDGHLYITDRKKQLFKLSTGKYVAPTPVEVALTSTPFIEQAIVVGSERKYCGALLVLDTAAVREHFGEAVASASDEDLPVNPDVVALIEESVTGANEGLSHWEQIKKHCILARPFTIEADEMTPTMKLRRRTIRQRYQSQIDALYAET